jgi:hypothetical protein
MPKRADRASAPVQTAAPFEIVPTAAYRPSTIEHGLGLRCSTILWEIRLGRLRAAKRAGRVFIFGRWILEWLADGELRKRAEAPSAN